MAVTEQKCVTTELRWRVWPACEWPRRTCVAVVVISALAVAAAMLLESSTAAGIAIGVLILANIRFFAPSNYRVHDGVITLANCFGTRSLALQQVRLQRFDHLGGLLADRKRPGPFASLRGIPLLFPREGGEAIAAALHLALRTAQSNTQ